MIRRERLAASLEGEFVVFLIGMRINQAVGTDGSVGVWHETYAASAGTYENIYVNMPPFGLGRAGSVQVASGHRQSARGRLGGKTDAT